jgi:hypothetical protein
MEFAIFSLIILMGGIVIATVAAKNSLTDPTTIAPTTRRRVSGFLIFGGTTIPALNSADRKRSESPAVVIRWPDRRCRGSFHLSKKSWVCP